MIQLEDITAAIKGVEYKRIMHINIEFELEDGGYLRIYESSPGCIFVACNGIETLLRDEDIPKVLAIMRLKR